ncbi:MAG: DUF805 domain-containing protein [Cocleimonas sp.]|nr:DUF805 domain-containing protein [Cocleimonas sp.]
MDASNTYSNKNTDRQRYSQVELFSSDGRIGRLRYFFYSLVLPFLTLSILTALAGIASQIGQIGQIVAYIILVIGISVALILLFQLTIQRCHDFNVSGWLSSIIIIPFGTFIFLLIPGSGNINRYGEPPEPTTKWIKIGAFLLFTLLVAAVTYWLLNYVLSVDINNLTV